MFGLKPLSSSRRSGSTIPCECLKWTGRCCSSVDCIGVVISLLAGNCLPYHQPFSITHSPCMCCSLPVMAHDSREEVLLACFPGGPTTDHPCSLLASPEASDESDVLSRCPHSTILSVTPSAQQTSGWEGPLVDCLIKYPLLSDPLNEWRIAWTSAFTDSGHTGAVKIGDAFERLALWLSWQFGRILPSLVTVSAR